MTSSFLDFVASPPGPRIVSVTVFVPKLIRRDLEDGLRPAGKRHGVPQATFLHKPIKLNGLGLDVFLLERFTFIAQTPLQIAQLGVFPLLTSRGIFLDEHPISVVVRHPIRSLPRNSPSRA